MYRVIIYNGTESTIIHEVSTDPTEPHLYSCTLTEGSPGEIDSLEFTILPNNPGYGSLHTRTTMVEVLNTKTNATEFTGRVLTMTPEMDSEGLIYKSVVCESQLGYLCDSIQPYTPEATYVLEDFFNLLLDNHNSQVEDYKKIYPGNISVTTSTGNVTKGLNYETTWECIKSKLLDSVGGEVQLYTSNGLLYLDYVEELGSRKEQTIELGKNMMSISQEIDPTEVITRLIPLGANLEQGEDSEEEVDTDERTTIASVNNGVIYLDDEDAQAVYGIVVGVVEWEDVTEPSNLLTKAKQWLEGQSITDQITLSAVDLSLIGLAEDSIERYNYYPIINDAIGLNAYFRVTKRITNICDPSDITYEMGSQSKALSTTLTDASNDAARAATDAVAAINAELSKTVTSLIASNAIIVSLQTVVAEIETAYIDQATIDEILAGYIAAGQLDAAVANILKLTTSELYTTLADIGYLTADSATIKTLNSDVANIIALLSGSIGTGTLEAIHITSDNVVIDDAVITSAMIKDIVADKITSGTIYTDYVKIANNTGENLLIDGSTIQINDGNVVRVQIGEDASGDYNLYLWNSGGTLIWDAQGLTEAGLTGNGAIIKDAAVADDAAISGYKLDIASVAERLNEDGSITVDAAQVTIDGNTLDYKLTTITDQINISITGTTSEYYLSTSATELSGGSWSTEQPTWTDGMYIWARTLTTYADGETEYSVAVCITGNTGASGSPGDDGQDGISYAIESTNGYIYDTAIDTTVTARIYQGTEELDSDGAWSYTWYAKDSDDEDYSYYGSGKTLYISTADSYLSLYFEVDSGESSESVYLVDENGNILTDEDGTLLLYEAATVTYATDEDGNILTDENGNILLIA